MTTDLTPRQMQIWAFMRGWRVGLEATLGSACNPTMRDLADEFQCSVATISEHLTGMLRKGWVREIGATGGARRYRAVIPEAPVPIKKPTPGAAALTGQ